MWKRRNEVAMEEITNADKEEINNTDKENGNGLYKLQHSGKNSDTIFQCLFTEEEYLFKNLTEVGTAVHVYEKVSGYWLLTCSKKW